MNTEIRPFTIAVGDDVLDDLRRRLSATRWPEPEPVDDWSQGVPRAYLQEVCDYWANQYDWRAAEQRLNGFHQYVTTIDELDIHFIHQRSSNPDARPLIITHGWPGTIAEFQQVIAPLTEPQQHGGDAADAFHIVAPSLPGFGFSGKPATTGWNVDHIADAWAQLMERLGYDRYVAQGGDWGSAVTAALGRRHPDHCRGIHMTLVMGQRPPGEPTGPEELHAIERGMYYMNDDSGYAKQQQTRPQTIGYALNDSPAGLAAWILEKFWSWTDHESRAHQGGRADDTISLDLLLDNLTIYWVTETAASSARIYWESLNRVQADPVTVPSGFSVYPGEIVPPVRKWIEEAFPISHWAEHDRGGHFSAFEVPDTFIADVRDCFRSMI